MLYLLLLLAAILACLLSMWACRRSSSSGVFGSLLIALVLSIGGASLWMLRGLAHLSRRELWTPFVVVLEGVFFVLPIAFTALYVLLVVLWRRRDAARARRFPFLTSWILTFVALGMIATGIYATRIERFNVEVTETTIRTAKLPAGTKPLRIVQITDTHIDAFGPYEERVLEIVRGLKPDVIVLTGDYDGSHGSGSAVNRFMKGLSAPEGVYAVDGNWDGHYGTKSFIAGTDIEFLRYSYKAIQWGGARILVGGAPWTNSYWSASLDPFGKDRWPGDYTVLLAHKPDISIGAPDWIDLIVSGHTHGGQVCLPWFGPLVTFSDVSRDKSIGLSTRDGGGLLYVSRGVGTETGTAPRIRFLCRPEIALITIAPE